MTDAQLHIPPELIENVAEGSCVLFLGADLPSKTADWQGPPNRAELAQALAVAYDWIPKTDDLRQAAEAYLLKRPKDRVGLNNFIKQQIETCTKPGPLHQTIVELGFDHIVYFGLDDLLEKAFNASGRRVLQVVNDKEFAYAGSKKEAIITRLAGTVSRPESLVLTRMNHILMQAHLSEKLRTVRGLCTLRPLLFLGWNPADEFLLNLYVAATETMGDERRRNYMIWPETAEADQRTWESLNIDLISANVLPFLRQLARDASIESIQTGLSAYRPGEVVHKPPYKFLDYFETNDRDIFCGRNVEAPLLHRLALSYPSLVLFGQSGVGKTSLLLAGVVPHLLADKYRCIYVRALEDPLLTIRQKVSEAILPDASGEEIHSRSAAGKRLVDFFTAALSENERLVIILDQFEELYTRPRSTAARLDFWQQIGECLEAKDSRVRFIFSLREDYLAYLDEARKAPAAGGAAPVPQILSNSYRLTSLEVDTAYLAIVEPARRARCEVEPRLAQVLLGREQMPGAADQEENLRWSLLETDGSIPPPALQIVMNALYKSALQVTGKQLPEAGETDWQPPALTLTLESYRSLGGAERILADYVRQALDETPAHGGERALAEALLKVMVTSQKTKAALNEADMIDGLVESQAAFDPVSDLGVLKATRQALLELRLLRSFRQGEEAFYELAHDHLAKEIATWITQEEMGVRVARELLRREMDNYRQTGLLIPLEALKIVHENRLALKRLDQAELELLLRSALAVGYEEAGYWFERAAAQGVAVEGIAQEGLKAESFRARAAAVQALAGLGKRFMASIIGMLGDLYPQVRMAAIQSLESLQPSGEWRKHLKYECYVPAGKFILGSDSNHDDEKPAHEVSLEAFYIGKYPVTNAEYQRYKADLGQPFDPPPGKENHPVVSVSWYDARDYTAWAGMRLLTEAEWEKAASWEEAGEQTGSNQSVGSQIIGAFKKLASGGAKEGKKSQYPWGDEFDKNKCNTSESGIGVATPVGKYSPSGDSPYGCADMSGNVFEWTSSLKKAYPYKANDGREDQHSGDPRVLRGGSFYDSRDYARCAYRYYYYPYDRYVNYGFRGGVSFPSHRSEL